MPFARRIPTAVRRRKAGGDAFDAAAPVVRLLGLVSIRAGAARGRHTLSLRAHFPDGELGATLTRPIELTDQAPGATVSGYVNQIWSGLTTQQLAAVCAALVDRERFAKVRAAGAVHHLAPNPPITKFDLLGALAALLRPDVMVQSANAPQSINRILTSRYRLLDTLVPRWPTWPDTLAAATRN